MFYSDELIEEIRSRNDIVDVISGYVKLKKQGSNYFGLCPFHNEKSPSFSVSSIKQMYYCFGCGEGGNVISFIMKYENYSFLEAIRLLAERAGVSLPEEELSAEAKKENSVRNQILEINKLAAKYYYVILRKEEGVVGLQYLKERELSIDTMQQFGLGFAGKNGGGLYVFLRKQGYKDDVIRQSGLMNVDEKHGMNDKFWNRVIFPIMDVNNRVIGFGGRVMGDGKPKYLNSPETRIFDKSRNLYGLNRARMARTGNIIVCEGYMDVIAMHQAGFTQAVASLGTAFTAGHANLLKRYTEEILLTYDSDEAGVKAALRAIPICKAAGLMTRVVDMKPYKDPDEFMKHLGKEAFSERLEKAENSFYFELRMLEREFQMSDPDGRTKFQEAVVKRLSSMENEIERNNYTAAAAAKYMIPQEVMEKAVARQAAKDEGIREIVRPKSGQNSHKEKEDGILVAQKLLLTWLVDEPLAFEKIKIYITPDDFTLPLYQKVAKLLFEQLQQQKLNPASIVSHFEEEEEHCRVAELFNTKLSDIQVKSEKEKALTDLVVKMKKNRLLSEKDGEMNQTDPLAKAIANRKAVEELKKIRISL